MNLIFNLLLSNLDSEYRDSLSLTFPVRIIPSSSSTDRIGLNYGQGDRPVSLNREGMQNGIYFYQVTSDEKLSASGKIIVN